MRPAMIHTLVIQRYKSHRYTSLGLQPLTLLVGPNGAGKTSVLEALDALGSLARGGFPWGDAARWHHERCDRGERGAIEVQVEGTLDDHTTSVALSLGPGTPEAATASMVWTDRGEAHEHAGAFPTEFPGSSAARMVRATRYDFVPHRVAAPAPMTSAHPSVEPDGYGTAPALAAIQLADREVFLRIESALRAVTPSVERLRVVPSPMGEGVGFRVSLDLRGVKDVPAEAAGTGTLVTLGLLTALHAPGRPRVVLLEELERSLHATVQGELVRQLHAIVRAERDLQVVATSYSPYVLDAFDLAEVRVLAQRADGSIAAKELGQHPEAPRLHGKLSPGQLWSLEDEASWVTAS